MNLARCAPSAVVVYAYPMTGRPGVTLPQGWDDIPGARGCTLETCGFRDHHAELAKLQAEVFGVSTQTTAYQQEMVTRLKVPFEVLSDAQFAFVDALRLPTFTVEGMTPHQAPDDRSRRPAASSTCSIRCSRRTGTPRK